MKRKIRTAAYVKLMKDEREPIEIYAHERGIPLSTAIRMLALDQLRHLDSLKEPATN